VIQHPAGGVLVWRAHLADPPLLPGGEQSIGFGRSHPVFKEEGHRQRALRGCGGPSTEAKEELQEVVTFLRQTGAIHRHRRQIPKGVLLVGRR